ncbi:MAG TPA: TerC family protein [Candidatus Polarisedimenticolia bacterium]|nr:TerC family protein [Candidatus Polarisedimenticolia bacterium]
MIDAPSVGTPILWIGYTVFILIALVVDLGVFHRGARKVSMKEAGLSSIIWISLALVFNAGIYNYMGPQKGLEFFTGYLIELALSVDNLFVFLIIFSYFKVPEKLRHRVLFWGILGAMLMRIIFILAGATLLGLFHWLDYVFGAFLLYTGIRIIYQKETEVDPEMNLLLRFARKYLRVTKDYEESKFFTKIDGKSFATPLLLVLLVVESTDVVFAVDSIPAIFGITHDPFIVYTSNIFAVLGLRALFFLLQGMMNRFHYLPIGLGLVLAFVGLKMLIAGHYQIPIGLSLGIVALVLFGSVIVSLLVKSKTR